MNTDVLYANIGLLFLQKEELRAENAALRKIIAELQAKAESATPTVAPATESAAQPASA